MNLSGTCEIALKNIRRKKVFIKVVLIYFLLFLFLLLFFFFLFVIINSKNLLLKERGALNCASEVSETSFSEYFEIVKEDNVSEIWERKIPPITQSKNIYIDDRSYASEFYIIGNGVDIKYFDNFPMVYGKDVMLMGEYIKNDDEVVISDIIFNDIGLSENDIGKKISIKSIFNPFISNQFIIYDMTLAGVYDSKALGEEKGAPNIFYSSDAEVKNVPAINANSLYCFNVYLDSYSKSQKTILELNEKYGLNLEIYEDDIIEVYSKIEEFGYVIIKISVLFLIGVTLGSVLYIYALLNVEKNKSKDLSKTLFAYGMTKNVKTLVHFFEHIILSFVAWLASFISAIFIFKWLCRYFEKTSDYSIKYNFLSYQLISIVVYVVFISIVIIIITMTRHFNKKEY